MKIKEGKKLLFVFAIIITFGSIGLIIYQALNSEIEPMNLLVVACGLGFFEESLETKK